MYQCSGPLQGLHYVYSGSTLTESSCAICAATPGATRHGSGSQMLRSTASLCRTRTAVCYLVFWPGLFHSTDHFKTEGSEWRILDLVFSVQVCVLFQVYTFAGLTFAMRGYD